MMEREESRPPGFLSEQLGWGRGGEHAGWGQAEVRLEPATRRRQGRPGRRGFESGVQRTGQAGVLGTRRRLKPRVGEVPKEPVGREAVRARAQGALRGAGREAREGRQRGADRGPGRWQCFELGGRDGADGRAAGRLQEGAGGGCTRVVAQVEVWRGRGAGGSGRGSTSRHSSSGGCCLVLQSSVAE